MPSPYAIVTGDFTPWGGMDRPNYELARHLVERRGAEVHLVSHRVADPLAEHPGVTWHRVTRPFGRHSLGAPLLDRRGRKVADAVRREGGTVVVNGGNCLWDDVNWVHYVHNTPGPPLARLPFLHRQRTRWSHWRDRLREREAVGHSRLVVADSDLVKNLLVAEVGVDPAKVRTIYYGIDPEQFHPPSVADREEARHALGLPSDRPIVAFIGALGWDRRKGFDVLFDAWRSLGREPGWDAILVVAGTGPELPLWRRCIAEAEHEKDVRFLGFSRAISSLLASADVLVSPTRFEPYGQGVHEAICCGLPALVTRCAGIAERYPADLQELLLDAPAEPAQLARRLLHWRNNMDALRRKVIPFSQELRRRNWDAMAAEILDAIEGGAR